MRCDRVRPFAAVLPLLLGLSLLPAGPAAGQDDPAAPPAATATDDCSEGKALYRSARFPEARAALQRCLAANGPAVDVLLPLVVMGVQAGRLTEAVEYGAAAVETAPNDPEARYWYGRALLRAERPADAKAQWEAGLANGVDHVGLLEGLARLALAEGEPAKAYQLLTQMQRLGTDEPWLDRLMADIAAGKGLWTQSLGHLEAAMAREGGGSATDLLTASELSILAGRKEAAVGFCREAVAREPGAATYGGLGEAFFALEQVDSATVYLRRAIEQDPDNARFRFNLANALEVSGQVEEADYHFRVFLQQVPEDPVGHFNYGIYLEKMGRMVEVLDEVSQAISLDPRMLTARVVRIQLLESLGRWDEALLDLGTLRDLDKANQADLAAWQDRLVAERDAALGQTNAGLVHLQHLVLGSADVVELVQKELAAGKDFTSLVVRFSSGPAAARGGDIGWVDPEQMLAPLGEAIAALGMNEISPPIESKGLYHIFKRIP